MPHGNDSGASAYSVTVPAGGAEGVDVAEGVGVARAGPGVLEPEAQPYAASAAEMSATPAIL
jgi:hypothetical protein